MGYSLRMEMTDAQRKVYEFIVDHIQTEGYNPTCDRIREEFGWASINAAYEHCLALERKGYLRRIGGNRGFIPAEVA